MSVMATSAANYNEVYNAVTLPDGRLEGDPSQMDPMFRWDTHFPDRLNRLTIGPDFTAPTAATTPATTSSRTRNLRNRRNRNAARFKTQPITFDEIKEVDEDNSASAAVAGAAGGTSAAAPTDSAQKETLKSQFANFSRSMDGLVVSPFAKRGEASPAKVSPVHCSSEEEHAECPLTRGGSATSATIQRQQFRNRRKKRHTKSIEEAPELDKTTDSQQDSKHVTKSTTG